MICSKATASNDLKFLVHFFAFIVFMQDTIKVLKCQ